MKILTVLGARPQFIKAGVVSRILADRKTVTEVIVHTGQHYDYNMSDIFFAELDLPEPDYHLGIGSASHGVQTGQMLVALDGVLMDERPDLVLVYGDTNSTLAGALSAGKMHIPIAHVEAGLRSFNRRMPEETNRVLTDHLSSLLFAPTENAVRNLTREGISAASIFRTGDVMYDAALYYTDRAHESSDVLERNRVRPRQYVLATIHRAENTDDRRRLSAIMRALDGLSEEIQVVMPLHPRTAAALSNAEFSVERSERFKVISPVGYIDMLMLERNAALVATDSGGVQKEAYFFRVPCVTLREETEWIELIESGWNRLVSGFDPTPIRRDLLAAISSAGAEVDLYGDGVAGVEIVRCMEQYVEKRGSDIAEIAETAPITG